MKDKYYTVRQFLTSQFQETYIIPNKLNRPNLSDEQKKLLESLSTFAPSISKILMVSKKCKKICIEKNLPFHKVSKGGFSKSSTYVFPENALKEAVGE